MSIDVPNPAASTSFKVIAPRHPDTSAGGSTLAVGEQAAWDRATRPVWCLPCAEPTLASVPAGRRKVSANRVGRSGRS